MSIFTGIKIGAHSSYPDVRTKETDWHCSQLANSKDLPTLSVEWQVSFNFDDEYGLKEPYAAVGSFNKPGYVDHTIVKTTPQSQPTPRSPTVASTPGSKSIRLVPSPESSTHCLLSDHPTPQDSIRSSSITLFGSPAGDASGDAPKFEVGDVVQVRDMVFGSHPKEKMYEEWVNGIVTEAVAYPNFDLGEEYTYQVKYYLFKQRKFQTSLFYPSYDQIRAHIRNITRRQPRIKVVPCSSRRCCHSWKSKCLELGGKRLDVQRGTYVFFQTFTRSNASGKKIWLPGRCISANVAQSEYWIQALGGPGIGREYWTQGPFNACTNESLERLLSDKAALDMTGWDGAVRCSCS